MSASNNTEANSVRPIIDGVITPKNYIDVVGISNKDETIREIPSTANGSNLYFEFQNLTCNSYLDRKVRFKFRWSFTITTPNPAPPAPPVPPPFAGGDGAKNIYLGLDHFVLRYSPVLANASNIEVSINNQKQTYPLNRYYEAISRFNGGDASESMRLSDSPMMHDYGRYVNLVNGGLLDYAGFSPFNGSDLTYNSRFNIFPVSINQAGHVATITYEWYEYLDLAPLTSWAKAGGFFNISSISVSINCPAINQQVNKFMSIEPAYLGTFPVGTTYDTVGFVNSNDQTMRLHTITAPFERPSPLNILPAENITYIATTVGAITNAGAIETLTTNNVSLSKVPSKIYLFANRAGENFRYDDATTYALIRKIKMTYGNRSNYFDNYTIWDLYNQFVYPKGFKVPFNIYKNFTGSVLCIEPQDIYDSLPAGTSCCTNLQFDIEFQNIYGANQQFQVMMVLVYDAVITYSRTTFNINDIIVDADAVLAQAERDFKSVPENILLPVCKIGSGIKDELISALSTVMGGIQSATKYYMQNKDWIDPLLETAKDMGLSAVEVMSALFAGGLHPNEVYERLSRVYPQPELNKVFKSLKSAGCCCDSLNISSIMDGERGGSVSLSMRKVKAKPASKKSKAKKRGGVMIQEEDDFDDYNHKVPLSSRY